jgi:hypothetical protein
MLYCILLVIVIMFYYVAPPHAKTREVRSKN